VILSAAAESVLREIRRALGVRRGDELLFEQDGVALAVKSQCFPRGAASSTAEELPAEDASKDQQARSEQKNTCRLGRHTPASE
jgi:hypothetical protein